MSDEQELNETIAKVQGFWQKFQTPFLIVLAVIVIGGGGWYGYREYILKPKEEKAVDVSFKAEEYYRLDSVNLALKGDGQNLGFLKIIDKVLIVNIKYLEYLKHYIILIMLTGNILNTNTFVILNNKSL